MNSVGASLTLGRELRDICGVDHVMEDQVELQAKHIAGASPALLLRRHQRRKSLPFCGSPMNIV